MAVTGASGDFTVGETITGNSASAPTAEVVSWTDGGGGAGTLTLKYVSTTFTASTEQITGGTSTKTATVGSITYSGDNVSSSTIQDAFPSSTPTYTTSQRRVTIQHSHHGMHDTDNNVVITGVTSEVSPTYLTSSISASDTTIQVNDATAFHTIINGANVGSLNLGYIKIEDEIMSYTGISGTGKTITVNERGLAGTAAVSHADETNVECYNLDGIPLIEINKTHTNIQSPTLDSYDLATSSIARLGIRSGATNVIASQNIQYEILSPQIQRMTLPKTLITARVNTITGTSINDGQSLPQNSFSNTGEFYDVNLGEDNYFVSPQLICSAQNESAELSGAKSFRMDLTLFSENNNVTPVVDTDRMSITTISHRINSPSDPNTAKLPVGDGHNGVYITKVADLSNPSSSIKLMFAGYRPSNTEIKPLYRVLPSGSTDSIETLGWEFFPTSDAKIPQTSETLQYYDYEYEVTGLDFSQYQVKLVFVSPNQAYSPIVKDLRAIALAV